MPGHEYVELPFYGSDDPEEYLEWVKYMELELKKFPKTKQVLRATMEFEEYASKWSKRHHKRRVVKTWQDLKAVMRKEFVLDSYEKGLFEYMKSIRQGFRSIESYYDELKSVMRRANIVDASAARANFKRGLNPDVAATVRLKYDGTMQDLGSYAIEEEKRIKKQCLPQFRLGMQNRSAIQCLKKQSCEKIEQESIDAMEDIGDETRLLAAAKKSEVLSGGYPG